MTTNIEGLDRWIQDVFVPTVQDDSLWPLQLGRWLCDSNLTRSRLVHDAAYFEDMDSRTFTMMYAHEDASYLLIDVGKLYWIKDGWHSDQLREFWRLFDERVHGAFVQWKAVVAEASDRERALRGIMRLALARQVGFDVLSIMKDDRDFPENLMPTLLDALSRMQTDDRLCGLWKTLVQRKMYPRFPYAAWLAKIHEHDASEEEVFRKFNIRVHDDKRTYKFGVALTALRGLLCRVDVRAHGTTVDVGEVVEHVGALLHPFVRWTKGNRFHCMQICSLVYERFPRSYYGYRSSEKSDVLIDIFYERLHEYGTQHRFHKEMLGCIASYIKFSVYDGTW